MILLQEVLALHEILIERFGGSPGIRDQELLESALSRPFQTFDGTELYPTISGKAAALIESMLINHPFVDGNKRTGYSLLRIYLAINRYEITASIEDRYEFVLAIATGSWKFDPIHSWVNANTRKSSA
ncbi:MAG: type II toxin-antitoxin system death-on-curing family toxin [Sphingobacteriales bacterium]|nr:MAG: type II toxin-antitoxin system death-on-curing family toxin [Sphingobacteriales bacterium]